MAHVGFRLDDGTLLDATPGVGVAIRKEGDTADVEYWEVLRPASVIEAAVTWTRAQVGKPYDWSAIAGFVWRDGRPEKRDWKNQSAWFCSELIEAAFSEVYAPLLQDSGVYNRITPRDLLLSVNIAKVGKLP